MRDVIAAVMASTLALSAHSQADDALTSVNRSACEGAVQIGSQGNMFDGIQLTEHQRLQLRDLMQRARYQQLPINVSEIETMHRLVTAEKFDETAVRAQTERMMQDQVMRQVEIARVRNQMYHLLTPEQQAVLNEKHQQRMAKLQDVILMQQEAMPTLLSSSKTRSNQ